MAQDAAVQEAASISAVVLKQVGKRYRKKTVLHPLSWEIPRGKCVALCGGNGAGKSTLLHMIAGLSRPSQGKIYLFGQPQETVLKLNRRGGGPVVRLMPDQVVFPPAMSAEQFLRLHARLQGVGQGRVDELLAELGLESARRRDATTFSKGMTQRLLLAQALLKPPALLLLDEPANGLDPYWSEQLGRMMKRLQRQGTTVLFSSHLLEDVQALAEDILLLHEGRVLYSGPLADLCRGRSLLEVYRETVRNLQEGGDGL